LVELLAYGGLRIGEALALRRRHVDVLGCKLIVAESLTEVDGKFTFGPTKNHQVRDVPLPRGLLRRSPDTLTRRSQRRRTRWCSPDARESPSTTPVCGAASTPPADASAWWG